MLPIARIGDNEGREERGGTVVSTVEKTGLLRTSHHGREAVKAVTMSWQTRHSLSVSRPLSLQKCGGAAESASLTPFLASGLDVGCAPAGA